MDRTQHSLVFIISVALIGANAFASFQGVKPLSLSDQLQLSNQLSLQLNAANQAKLAELKKEQQKTKDEEKKKELEKLAQLERAQQQAAQQAAQQNAAGAQKLSQGDSGGSKGSTGGSSGGSSGSGSSGASAPPPSSGGGNKDSQGEGRGAKKGDEVKQFAEKIRAEQEQAIQANKKQAEQFQKQMEELKKQSAELDKTNDAAIRAATSIQLAPEKDGAAAAEAFNEKLSATQKSVEESRKAVLAAIDAAVGTDPAKDEKKTTSAPKNTTADDKLVGALIGKRGALRKPTSETKAAPESNLLDTLRGKFSRITTR